MVIDAVFVGTGVNEPLESVVVADAESVAVADA